MKFKLVSKFKPTGDQPQAIKKLVSGLKKKYPEQTLLGVTGSGKTFTMANVIEKVQKPTLVISHNKTLAAQLASEFKEFFPENAVHYFVSYYDYYQPEAYIPRNDTYIEKETQLNEEIDRLRHASTQALLTRKDVIIVASVSCIYGLGPPEKYGKRLTLKKGQSQNRRELFQILTIMQYQRNDIDFRRGTFRVKGEVVDIFPSFSLENIFRLTFFGDEIEKIEELDSLTGNKINSLKEVDIFPATHYMTYTENIKSIFSQINKDLAQRLKILKKNKMLVEAQRLEQRTKYDLEMIEQTGYCSGIENYSRYFDGRKPGEPPYTLLEYFPAFASRSRGGPKDYLMFIDESHMTVPQIGGMYEGDHSRKTVLVDFGFRLPSALDNRPLKYPEFQKRINQVIYVSATPATYEKERSKQVVEQLLRPTGLLDPDIEIKAIKGQIDDLITQIKKRVAKKQRVLVTTLTKRISEQLTDYLKEMGIKVQYLHSEVDTLERIEILRDLRLGKYDVVVGINLLREGLDLPEVSLIAILDADKEGFLRSDVSLIQTMGRAARHQEGHIIMYADKKTGSMERAIAETERRRKYQEDYNKKHKIKPQTIKKAVREDRLAGVKPKKEEVPALPFGKIPKEEILRLIHDLENQMNLAAQNLQFERAATLRDQIKELRKVKK